MIRGAYFLHLLTALDGPADEAANAASPCKGQSFISSLSNISHAHQRSCLECFFVRSQFHRVHSTCPSKAPFAIWKPPNVQPPSHWGCLLEEVLQIPLRQRVQIAWALRRVCNKILKRIGLHCMVEFYRIDRNLACQVLDFLSVLTRRFGNLTRACVPQCSMRRGLFASSCIN